MTNKHGGYVRGRAEYVSDAVIRYIWPCGHTQKKDHMKGPIPKRIPQMGCKFLVRYWGRSGGVNLSPCKRCRA